MWQGNTRRRSRDLLAESERDLERAADRLLAQTDAADRVYTEKQLSRRIRLESARQQTVEETDMPREVTNYLVRRQIELMVEWAVLTRFQAAVLAHVMEGHSIRWIASHYGLAFRRVAAVLKTARRKILQTSCPYDGLYEVYWSEVNRYVYRKPRKR